MKKLILISFIFIISACASHNPNEIVAIEKDGDRYYTDESASQALAEGDESNVICERRIITGSHRVNRVCTTKKQKQRDRDDAREIMHKSDVMKSRKITGDGGN